jgi:hypothetical protein
MVGPQKQMVRKKAPIYSHHMSRSLDTREMPSGSKPCNSKKNSPTLRRMEPYQEGEEQ